MKGPSSGAGGEDITWPDQMAPWSRKAPSTRNLKPQTSNFLELNDAFHLLRFPGVLMARYVHQSLARGTGPTTEAISYSVVLSRDIDDAQLELRKRLVPSSSPCRWT